MTSTPPNGGSDSTNLGKTESSVCASCGAVTVLLRTYADSCCPRRICSNCLGHSSRSWSNYSSRTFPNVREAVSLPEMDAISPAPIQNQQNQPAAQPQPFNVLPRHTSNKGDQVVPQIEDFSD